MASTVQPIIQPLKVMDFYNLQSLLHEHQIKPTTILYLIEQGIELEKLKLEVNYQLKAKSIDSFTAIMQGERFISLLSFSLFR